MKIVKWLLLAAVVLIALPFVVGLFLKSTFVVEREIVVDRPHAEVWKFVKLLRNNEQYSKWNDLDPKMAKAYRGEDGTPGFVYAWESKDPNVGRGEQEITKVTGESRIDYEIRILEPFQSADPLYTLVEPAGEGRTKVKSVYTGKMNYPMNLLCFMVEDMIGKNMQGSLVNLKGVLEKAPAAAAAPTAATTEGAAKEGSADGAK